MNVPIEYHGDERKPVCMITPDEAMAETLSLVEHLGSITAATKRPETMPASTPDSVKNAVVTTAPIQVHPTYTEHDLAGFPLGEERLSDVRRQQACTAMDNALGVDTPCYAATPGNPLLPISFCEQVSDKALNLLDATDELVGQVKMKNYQPS